MENFEPPPNYNIIPEGEMELKGKEETKKLYALTFD
jgi:hypothetical protein